MRCYDFKATYFMPEYYGDAPQTGSFIGYGDDLASAWQDAIANYGQYEITDCHSHRLISDNAWI